MNISQALKEKNKKAAYLAKLVERFTSSNTHEEGTEKDYSSKATLDEIKNELSGLVNLKQVFIRPLLLLEIKYSDYPN